MREELLPRFVEIPAGEFAMGAADGEDDERPVRRVALDRFHIAMHQVTNAQYAEFVRNTGHRAPDVRDLPSFVSPSAEAAFRELASPYIWRGGDLPRDRGLHPVTLVTHADAVAYCVWLGTRLGRAVRLPSEAEWERAARGGVDGRRYPWGDEVDPSRSNFLPDSAPEAHARHAAGRHVSGQRLRPARHGRQRLGMGGRLVRARRLSHARRRESAAARRAAPCACCAADRG